MTLELQVKAENKPPIQPIKSAAEVRKEMICPDCGNTLIEQGSCPICLYCGFSLCG